jgi:NADPH2:quinone reductase
MACKESGSAAVSSGNLHGEVAPVMDSATAVGYRPAMRAIVMNRVGGPEVLEPAEAPDPAPRAGEVLVELRATGVNFADTEWRTAKYRPTPLPWILGSEGAGVVVATGEGVDAAWKGRRVVLYAAPPAVSGTYAELATCPVSAVVELPESVGFETGAAILAQGLTAHLLVHRAARVRAGEVVLVHAAAGGVGLLAVQMARRLGARVLGTVSSDAKAAAVRAAGGEPLRYGEDVPAPVDVVLDSVGAPTQAASLAMLAPFGRLIHFGDAGGMPRPVDPDALYARSLSVGAFGLDAAQYADGVAQNELVAWAADGTIAYRIDRTLPLAQAAEAHRLLESRATIGKLVLIP